MFLLIKDAQKSDVPFEKYNFGFEKVRKLLSEVDVEPSNSEAWSLMRNLKAGGSITRHPGEQEATAYTFSVPQLARYCVINGIDALIASARRDLSGRGRQP